ncbi:MAG: hypothetical protein KDA96_09500 [Planctomycetaceae bacterium]|nr:hypothetical protein [Planctomycetaceae bacterium]
MMRSLRWRLILGISVTTMLVLLIANTSIYLLLSQRVRAEFDAALTTRLGSLDTLIEQTDESIVVHFDDRPMPEFTRSWRPEYFQVWDDRNAVIARSRRLGESDLPQLRGTRHTPSFQNLQLKDGRSGRAAGIQFLPHVKGEQILEQPEDPAMRDRLEDIDEVDFTNRHLVTLVVARDTRDLDQTLTRLIWVLLMSGAAATIAICGILSWLVTQHMHPLHSLSRQIDRVNESQLDAQFELPDAPAELQPVVHQLNELLMRLDAAFLREKTLTANIAHELRTPLAGIRTTLEVADRRNRDVEEYRHCIRRCLAICHETEAVVSTLLALARGDCGPPEECEDFVDVSHVLQTTWQQITEIQNRPDLLVSWNCDDRLVLRTDPNRFRVVICNLLNNAASYTNADGDLRIHTSLRDDGLCIQIINSGCAVPAEQVSQVFERFWRGDRARAATGIHAGLGLALCKQIVGFLSGQISAGIESGRFLVTLSFPREHVEVLESTDCGLTS